MRALAGLAGQNLHSFHQSLAILLGSGLDRNILSGNYRVTAIRQFDCQLQAVARIHEHARADFGCQFNVTLNSGEFLVSGKHGIAPEQ